MKKLPVKSHFLFTVAFFYLMTSCKKESSVDLVSTPSSDGKGIQVRLTSEEQALLADLISKEGVKDSIDFLNKISYVKSKCNNQKPARLATNSTVVNTGSYNEGREEISLATFNTTYPEEVNTFRLGLDTYEAIHNNQIRKSYKNVGSKYTRFVVRGNEVMFSVPHIVTVTTYFSSSSSEAKVTRVIEMPGSPPSIKPVGPFWGTYESKLPAYVDDISNNTANVHAEGTETRTRAYSVDGRTKISTESNLAVFKAGVEMEAGFTIQSAQNIYNQYILDGSFSIQLVTPASGEKPPVFNFASALKCMQYGILRNQ